MDRRQHPATLFSAQPWKPFGYRCNTAQHSAHRDYNNRGRLPPAEQEMLVLPPLAQHRDGQLHAIPGTPGTGSVRLMAVNNPHKFKRHRHTGSGTITISGSPQSTSVNMCPPVPAGDDVNQEASTLRSMVAAGSIHLWLEPTASVCVRSCL